MVNPENVYAPLFIDYKEFKISADNYILICKKTFEVFDGCASNDNLIKVGQGKNLNEAIEIAEEFEQHLWGEGLILEYGIHFSNNTRGYRVLRVKIRRKKEVKKDE